MQLADLWTDAEAAVLGLPPWAAVLVILGGSLALAWLVRVGGDVVIRRLTRRIDGDVDDAVFSTLHPPLYVSVLIGGVYLAGAVVWDFTTFGYPVRSGTLSILVVLWAWTLTRLGRRVATAASDEVSFDRKILPIFQNVWTAIVLGASTFVLLTLWSVDVTPLLASAGIVGIVVGFAAKDTIANFFGSIALYADGTYAVGDFVVLDSGERGRVEDISIRSTVIRTRDDMLVTVPNSVLNSALIVNESTPGRDRRVRVPVGVAYDSDLEHVESVLKEVAAAEGLIEERPKPRVRYRSFSDSAVDVELLGWIDDPVLRGRVTHRLVKAVHAAFREEGIEIPFPQRELTVVGGAPDGTADAGLDGTRDGHVDAATD
ncbi:mechanosensitive ion channel family protein [Halorientalis pallida]|uniref:Mechanosensitive ion channel family protein n=1 Tax=Halorientalis pallida TaxID=2479928 RepID=A0A498L1H7_9EURY|nr:mechanosensitive ion channel family protein [Halorientalis pallida]RXK47411.1 mechanosensitive ion channel family protein [Halorientalis pallida]